MPIYLRGPDYDVFMKALSEQFMFPDNYVTQSTLTGLFLPSSFEVFREKNAKAIVSAEVTVA